MLIQPFFDLAIGVYLHFVFFLLLLKRRHNLRSCATNVLTVKLFVDANFNVIHFYCIVLFPIHVSVRTKETQYTYEAVQNDE